MKIDQVSVSDLKPAPYNPRALTEEEFAQLKKSLEQFGFVEPLVVNGAPSRFNIVVGGHQRLNVAKALGFAKVPVFYVNLSEAEEQNLNLRLNKNTGHWDWDELANFDFDLLTTVGFTQDELEKNLNLEFGPASLEEQGKLDKKEDVICPNCSHAFKP